MATTFTKSTTPDLTKSIQHRIEELILTIGAVGWVYDNALAVVVPSTSAGGANTSVVTSVATTVTGVKVSADAVVYANPVVALPSNCLFLGAYVSADDTVTFTFGSTANAAITGASKNFELLVADRT